MKKALLLFSTFLLVSYTNAQKLIAVQNGGTPNFYNDLSEAIEGAVAGDTLYIPGRNYVVNDTIRVRMHLIGTGYHPDFNNAAGITVLSKVSSLSTQLHFANGSDGSSVTGIRFESTTTAQGNFRPNITSDISIERLSIVRNYFRSNVTLSTSGSFISENFFTRGSSFNNSLGTNSLVSNNVFSGATNSFQNCVVENNVFRTKPTYSSTFTCSESTFRNNIFPHNPFYGGFAAYDSTFHNNINIPNGSFQQGCYGINNIDPNLEIEIIFDESNLTQFLEPGSTFEYELPIDSSFLTAGQNGDQVGIHGGRFPWKEGSIPFNPHIVSKNISGSTDENGNLPIQIEVQAQEN